MLFNVVNNISTKNRHKITTRISKKQYNIITKNLKCHYNETIIFVWHKRYRE